MELALLSQQFEMGNRNGVMRERLRGMEVRKWMWMEMEMVMAWRKMEETRMGREIGIQTGIEMGTAEKRMEMGTQLQTATVTEMRGGIGLDLVSLMAMGFLPVRWTGIPM